MTLDFFAALAVMGAGVAAVSFAVTSTMTRHAARLGFVDAPNERSLHAGVKPRAGGVGFVLVTPLATIVGANLWIGYIPPQVATFLFAATMLALVSLADDRWGLSVGVRLLAQLVAALLFVLGGGVLREIALPGGAVLPFGFLASAVTIGWLVAFTNIYNFMDGSDGLAAGQAIVAASAMGLLAMSVNVPLVTIAMAALAAGVAGFLILNWPPARIFMGDVGSTFLGFTFAGWAVLAGDTRNAPLPFLAWMTVLSPFLFDGVLTMIRRIARGERIHQAHREHMYQRLVRSGWSHKAVAVLYIGLAAGTGALMLAAEIGGLHPIVFAGMLAAVLSVPVVLTRR